MKRRIGIAAVSIAAAAVLAGTGAAYAAGTGPAQTPAHQTTAQAAAKPTIVLVHGAFADSSSWSTEISDLQGQGYPVVAVANPLRGVASDAAYLESVLHTINGPIVLVGHSYAGFLISQAAADDPEVKALVYVAAYIPVTGETPAALTYKDPGSLLSGTNLVTRTEPTGTDIYINPAAFGPVYAGGLSNSRIATASVVQRPIAAAALSGPAVVDPPAVTPKWEIVALDDHAIPTTTQYFMAERAHATVVPTHSGHDVPQAQPQVVDYTILQAAHAVG